jgi:adenosylcobinamide-phosphate synthase
MLLRFLLLDIFIACILDLMIGDPEKFPHPVKGIALFIKKIENLFLERIGKKFLDPVKTISRKIMVRSKTGETYEKVTGFFLLFVIATGSLFAIWATLYLLQMISLKIFSNYILFHIVNTYIIFSSISAKALANEAYKVFLALDNRNIFEARRVLSKILGRDTLEFSEVQLVKATIETTAENTVNGIISPLFFAFLGSFWGLSAPLAYLYKSINTLDSMVGYKNDRYKYFGFPSAKANDIFNYIPARITGLFIFLAALLGKFDYHSCWRVLKRDRNNHLSPNTGYPQAAFAGAINVTLGGNRSYGGKLVEKPQIGDSNKDMIKNDIVDATRLMYITFFVGIFLFLILATLISFFLL